jgi:hypothetical protein
MAPVLPLLRRNYESNLSPAALRGACVCVFLHTPQQTHHLFVWFASNFLVSLSGPQSQFPPHPPPKKTAASGDGARGEAAGRITVAELDWANPEHYCGSAGGVRGPYDFVLAADCVYHERIVRHLYRCVLALTNERSTVIVANERRSESVQAAFVDLFSASFTFKKVPAAKQAEGYRHPAIELWVLKRRKGASAANLDALEAAEAAAAAAGGGEESAAAAAVAAAVAAQVGDTAAVAETAAAAETAASTAGASLEADSSNSSGNGVQAPDAVAATSAALASHMVGALGVSRAPTFEERRAGAEAAKMLAGVAVPPLK